MSLYVRLLISKFSATNIANPDNGNKGAAPGPGEISLGCIVEVSSLIGLARWVLGAKRQLRVYVSALTKRG